MLSPAFLAITIAVFLKLETLGWPRSALTRILLRHRTVAVHLGTGASPTWHRQALQRFGLALTLTGIAVAIKYWGPQLLIPHLSENMVVVTLSVSVVTVSCYSGFWLYNALEALLFGVRA